jgi:Bacterial SH3 domain
MTVLRTIICLLLLTGWPDRAHASFTLALDLPACERLTSDDSAALELGIVQPGSDANSMHYLLTRVRAHNNITLCAESWNEILPLWQPIAPRLEKGIGWVVYLAAFLLVLLVAHYVLPRQHWARPTLVGLLTFAAAVWLVAAGGLALFAMLNWQNQFYHTVLSIRSAQSGPLPRPLTWHEVRGARELQNMLASLGHLSPSGAHISATEAAANPSPIVPVATPVPAGRYLTAQRVNFRVGPGIAAARQYILPRLTSVTFAGQRQNDWWQVRLADGQTGWVSSLWLRRAEELPLAPGKG